MFSLPFAFCGLKDYLPVMQVACFVSQLYCWYFSAILDETKQDKDGIKTEIYV